MKTKYKVLLSVSVLTLVLIVLFTPWLGTQVFIAKGIEVQPGHTVEINGCLVKHDVEGWYSPSCPDTPITSTVERHQFFYVFGDKYYVRSGMEGAKDVDTLTFYEVTFRLPLIGWSE